jgi:predicted glycosyltransferase
MRSAKQSASTGCKKIWIDLDNSPHVPFFAPIIEEMRSRGYSVLITARDCFQVCELADLHGLDYQCIGRHYGKNKFLKLAGLCTRVAQLAPTILSEKPDLALSHGSRAQLLLSKLLGVPSMIVMDYEFAKGLALMQPSWIMIPETIPETALELQKSRILKYPGIKEDVYANRLRPDAKIISELGFHADDVIVTVRPPANEAHYHNPESDGLFEATIRFLSTAPKTKMVLLPRNQAQEAAVRKSWQGLFDAGQIVVPPQAVDGLNLIWHSDLVISGGGTMNREAAALGVPVYSIFRGKIGAVDRYLAEAGRLVLLENAGDVRSKISLVKRRRPNEPGRESSGALTKIVDDLVAVLDPQLPAQECCIQ